MIYPCSDRYGIDQLTGPWRALLASLLSISIYLAKQFHQPLRVSKVDLIALHHREGIALSAMPLMLISNKKVGRILIDLLNSRFSQYRHDTHDKHGYQQLSHQLLHSGP